MTIKIKNQALIDFRKQQGLNQIQLAEKLQVTQALIAMVENGTRKAPQSLRDKLKEVFNFDLPKEKEPENFDYKNIVPVPLYNIGAAAGAGTWLMNDYPSETLYFDSRWLRNVLKVNPNTLSCIFASGDSMDSGFTNTNSIKDGDLLLVDTSNKSGNNGIFVIRVNNTELRVKRLVKKLDGSLVIISDNPKYPEETYTPNNSDFTIEVIGKVVWNGSRENV